MSSDKRRKARVQGGWASSSAGRSRPVSRPSEDNISISSPPNWLMATHCSDPVKEQKFFYEEPMEKIKEKPKERIIEQTGVYNLSESQNGVSRIRLFNNFLEEHERDHAFRTLKIEMPWKQRSDVKNGVEYLQPRLTAWFGDHPYSYSGVTHPGTSELHPVLKRLKYLLEESTGLKFNSVLANLYRDGHDHVPWHADDEASLGPQPTIASISLGDVRNFELRKKLPKGTPEEEYEYVEHVRIPLEAGSLLIMEGCIQDEWQHRIKREYHDRGPRINLTYRVILPP